MEEFVWGAERSARPLVLPRPCPLAPDVDPAKFRVEAQLAQKFFVGQNARGEAPSGRRNTDARRNWQRQYERRKRAEMSAGEKAAYRAKQREYYLKKKEREQKQDDKRL